MALKPLRRLTKQEQEIIQEALRRSTKQVEHPVIEAMARAMLESYGGDELDASLGRDGKTRTAIGNRMIEAKAAAKVLLEAMESRALVEPNEQDAEVFAGFVEQFAQELGIELEEDE